MWTEAGPRAPAKRTLGTLPVTVHTLRTHPSIPAATPKGRYHKHPHFIKRETEAERCDDSAEVTQLVSNRAGTQAVGDQHPDFPPPKQVAVAGKGWVGGSLTWDFKLGGKIPDTTFAACGVHLGAR